jgi:ribosomal protein L20A (L18A)
MSNDKSNAKATATEPHKVTRDQKAAAPALSATGPVVVSASQGVDGPSAATPISSTRTADTTESEGKRDATASSTAKAEKKPKAPTKMEVASAIYSRMSRHKDVTRKQIVEQFVAEAKLSAAGASTYYQLIKAKLG